MPAAPVLSGPQYLREGLKLVLSPGLRLFVLLPLAINLILFVSMISFAVQQFSGWVDTFMPSLPNWLSFLQYILWPLFVVLVLLMCSSPSPCWPTSSPHRSTVFSRRRSK